MTEEASGVFESDLTWLSPLRLTDRPYWVGHIPFAFWLVDVLRPRLFVELGTETGVSFCAVCQAVAQVAAPTHAVAVDTWVGDGHTGVYSESVFEDLSSYVRTNYSSFAQLVRSSFDDAVGQFADASIDLLHIDGSHLYEDVKHDFETWLPKLSRCGVVLFHDIVERQSAFGVWKFWGEVSGQYPSFAFNHSSGLGVLVVGPEVDARVRALTQMDEASAYKIRMIYSTLGDRIALKAALATTQPLLKQPSRDGELPERIAAKFLEIENELRDKDIEPKSHIESIIDKNATIERTSSKMQVMEQRINLVEAGSASALLAMAQQINQLQFNQAQKSGWLTRLARSLPAIKKIMRLAIRPRRALRLLSERRGRKRWSEVSGRLDPFDAKWYVSEYPDVLASGISPLDHYLRHGSAEGRAPNSLFDGAWYLAQYPDVRVSGQNPFEHYLRFGAAEGRDPCPLFDTDWYLAENPDVAAVGVNPLIHYLHTGFVERRDPHPLFEAGWYLARYPEAAASGQNPLTHYLLTGAAKSYTPSPLFEPDFYLQQVLAQAPLAQRTMRADFRRAASRKLPVGAARSRIFAYTSVTLNYIPKARVLAESMKAHNPDIKFCLLVNEPVEAGLLDDLTIFDEIKSVDELNLSDLKAWIFSHTLVELCTAVKGFYLQELLRRPDCAAAFYFDPDIVVFDKIDPLLRGLDQASILLTPHLTDPEETVDAILDNELAALKHGVYNLGFLGVKPSPEGLRFAQWWLDRLERFCRADIPNGMFTDQRWVDLAPAFFPDIAILRHPGCNVATWNLSHRRIEGSFSTGFRVNGEPLIFYHFSGFDSGAQEIMLIKYGQGMSAAHDLRTWYIANSERPEDQEFFTRKPFYDSFDNGELITNEQRRLYRDRQDLQQAFPDPFNTRDPAASYLEWYRANEEPRGGRLLPTGGHGATKHLLAHFIALGAAHGLRPSPMFDPAFYLRSNPDVAASGVNPLVHYRIKGARERRKPAEEFNVGYYVEQLRPEERDVCSDLLRHYYEYGRQRGLRVDPYYKPEVDARSRHMVVRACADGRPTLLLVMHYGDGGADKHVQDVLKLCRAHVNTLLINANFDGSVKVTHQGLRVVLTFGIPFQWGDFLAFLRDCGVYRIHVHHLLGNDHYLRRLIAALGVPFDYTVHDYYALSPQPHLIGTEGRFVGEDLQAAEQTLLEASLAPVPPRSLREWQSEKRWMLTDADRVIVPTNDIKRRYQANLPSFQPIVAAHPDTSKVAAITRPALPAGSPLRIACLGMMAEHKGLKVLAACARLAGAFHDPLEFYLIGYAGNEQTKKLLESGVNITGRYTDDNLTKLLATYSPHLLWYPAQCPESFSYTLSEGMRTSLPLVVPDLGSFPERVGGRAWTWVRRWDLEPEEWLAFFLEVRERNFAIDAPPEPVGIPWQITDDFYRKAFLSWVDWKDDTLTVKIQRG